MNILGAVFKRTICALSLIVSSYAFGDNQTATVTPMFPPDKLPFNVKVKIADFSLPNGIQSYIFGVHDGKWLLITGRTNGLHGFTNTQFNFPIPQQNKIVYVIDPKQKKVHYRYLNDAKSGLNQVQIDLLSVTAKGI